MPAMIATYGQVCLAAAAIVDPAVDVVIIGGDLEGGGVHEVAGLVDVHPAKV